MIFAEKKNTDEKMFLELLESTKVELIKLLKVKPLPNSTEFELLVCDVMQKEAEGTEFSGTIRQTRVAAFPDLVVNGYFGVEVKMTVKDHWRSTGNSILESLREKDVERIYILFGKLGGAPDIKYRLYQDCLPEVSVTHSPRYRIDMNLSEGQSIFDKIGIQYDDLRKNKDSIQEIKLYYRSQLKAGESLWWIGEETEAPSLVIKQFKNLTSEEKERFKIDCMILLPELFQRRANYERAAAYMITEFGAVSTSLRDSFTAGGTQDILLAKKERTVTQLLSRLYECAPQLFVRVNEIDEAVLKFYWQTPSIESKRIEQWKGLVDASASDNAGFGPPSVIFESGYKSVKK